MLTTSKANKINLDHISGLELIDDSQAESISAGAFTWDTGHEEGVSQERFAYFNIERATKLELRNIDSNSPLDVGHNFEVVWFHRSGEVVHRSTVRYGDGIADSFLPVVRGWNATHVHVTQARPEEGCSGFICNLSKRKKK